MTEFRGGPRDGEKVEEEHTHAAEVQVKYAYYTEQGEYVRTEEHRYTPDSFGNLIYRGPLA